MAPKAQTVVAITGSQDLLRRRALRTTVMTQEKGGWRIDQVDGSNTGALRNATSAGGGFFESNRVLVIVSNPEKANLDVLEQHLTEGDPECVLLLYYTKDPKETSKFGKFLTKLGKAHRHYPAPAKAWQAEELAVKFCVEEAQRNGKTLETNHAGVIVERAGTDLGVLSFEILKMSMLAEAEGSTVLTAQIIGGGLAPLIEASLKPLTDALAAKNKIKLCKILGRIRKTTKGDPTIQVCRWLGKSALDWLMAINLRDKGVSAEEAAEQLSLNVYFYKNQILPKVRTWTLFEATQLVKALADSERAVLNGHVNPWVCMTARLLRVCDGKGIDQSPVMISMPYREAARPPLPDFTKPCIMTPPIRLPIPDELLKLAEDYGNREKATGSEDYRQEGDGHTKSSDAVLGKILELVTPDILTKHYGFPSISLDPNLRVLQKKDKRFDVDLDYPTVDARFPGVHCKATSWLPVSGSLQWKDEGRGRRDAIFKTHNTTVEENPRSEMIPKPEGDFYKQPLVGWYGTTDSTELIVLGFVDLNAKIVEYHGWVPWKYVLEHGLLQESILHSRKGLKRCIYVQNILYRMGSSSEVFSPELTIALPTVKKT